MPESNQEEKNYKRARTLKNLTKKIEVDEKNKQQL
jgi:hypothetical protein